MDTFAGVVQHFFPGEIMTGHCLHKSDIALSFGVYCQVAENVQSRISLAPWMRAAILMSSSNLSGGWSSFPCIGYRPHNNQTSAGCPTNATHGNWLH
jgi:hypothetical protein